MPHLATVAEQTSSIGLTNGNASRGLDGDDVTGVGKWEDEEERRFYEDITDLRDFVPKSILGIEEADGSNEGNNDAVEEMRKKQEEIDIQRLESEMETLKVESTSDGKDDPDDESVAPFTGF